MSTQKVEQTQSSAVYRTTPYMSKPEDKEDDKYGANYFLEMKAQDAEIKRASQQANDIYRLQLQARDGNCNAIEKLINYDFKNFHLDCDFAQTLQEEASQLLAKQLELYTTSTGTLSDLSINAAKEQVTKDCEGKTEVEQAQEYNALISEMELGCYLL